MPSSFHDWLAPRCSCFECAAKRAKENFVADAKENFVADARKAASMPTPAWDAYAIRQKRSPRK